MTIKQKPISLKGKNALILSSPVGVTLRLQHEDGSFTDCDLAHSDLSIQITDDDAYLYQDENGNCRIDYSEQTLGISSDSREV